MSLCIGSALIITAVPYCMQEAARLVALLQALQRLSTSRFASAEALVASAAVKRVFGALSCGDAAVAAEAARLLMRLWAPAVRSNEIEPRRQVASVLACREAALYSCPEAILAIGSLNISWPRHL